jgi:capsular polysaccharide biosynthesis protein
MYLKGGNSMEETINLQDILKTLKKRFKLIVSTTLGAGLLAVIISFFFITPIYEANTQVLVNQKNNEVGQQVTSADIQSNLQLINTYYEVIKSPAILNVVVDNLNVDLTAAQLASKLTVSSTNNSQVIDIKVQDESYEMAVTLANEIVKVFQKQIPLIMSVDNVNVLAPAEYVDSPSPVKPQKALIVFAALILGLLVGIAVAFLLKVLDKTVKTEQDIEELLNIPVIGLVSPIPDSATVNQQLVQRRRQPSSRSKVGL